MDQHDPSEGDTPTGIEAFRDAQLPRVRAYVAVVCSPERAEDAESAALVDLLARAGATPTPPERLEHELLCATRSGAAGRFNVVVPVSHPELHLTAECRAMPELLALHANGERPEDEALIASHLAGCAACAHTLDRMREAERAFARGVGELPQLEVEETSVALRTVAAAGSSSGEPNPIPEPETSGPRPIGATERPPAPATPTAPATPAAAPPVPAAPPPTPLTVRRRSGGLVGAIRKLGRPRGQ